ncbi:DUF4350 domain-containing protein [Desulfurococcus mucosus]|nr:DUF4350 domain-containing protein [Desulfurococcus mucosus]
MSKAYWLGVLVLSLLMIGYSNTQMSRGLVGDPPSIYNNMPGGLTIFTGMESLERRVNAIYSFSEVEKYTPRNHALLVVGPDTSLEWSPTLAHWVEEGGLLVVMDESPNSQMLLEGFEIHAGSGRVIQEVAVGVCNVGNASIRVVFNVYAEVYSTSRHEVLCRVGGVVTGLSRRIGGGEIVVIGDSSLVINEVLSKSPTYGNKFFLDAVTAGRNLVFYEGNRLYSYSSTQSVINYIKGFTTLATSLTQSMYWSNPVQRTTLIIIVIAVTLAIILLEFGSPVIRGRKY